jgi:hypothetical protein
MNHLTIAALFWLLIVICTAFLVLGKPRKVPTLLSYGATVIGAMCLGHAIGAVEMALHFHQLH